MTLLLTKDEYDELVRINKVLYDGVCEFHTVWHKRDERLKGTHVDRPVNMDSGIAVITLAGCRIFEEACFMRDLLKRIGGRSTEPDPGPYWIVGVGEEEPVEPTAVAADKPVESEGGHTD